jgi:small subunit ribosomal protein S5
MSMPDESHDVPSKSREQLTPKQTEILLAMAQSGELADFGVIWLQFRHDESREWPVVRIPDTTRAATAVAKALQAVRSQTRGPGTRPIATFQSDSRHTSQQSAQPAPKAARRRARQERDVSESGVEAAVVRIYRCSKVAKGGRTFSFGALVVAGDRKGYVGIGYGKANEVPPAVERATKEARKNMIRVSLKNSTIPHLVKGTSGASSVVLRPARPGTGVTAGKSVRPCLELAGIRDILSKAYGSTSPKNLVKATIDALTQLRTREQVEQMRGVRLQQQQFELV